MSSPLHVPGPAGTAWTRGNLGEALPGLCTPLSWTFFGYATELGLRSGFHRIGALSGAERPIPASVGERFVTAVYGWPAANIDMMAAMAERLPGVDPAQVERELFGETRDVPRHPTRRRYPLVAVRFPYTLARCLGQVRDSRTAVNTWWRQTLADLRRPEATPEDALRVLSEARGWFTVHMALHTIISMVASGLYDELAALTSQALTSQAGAAHSPARLITGYGTLEETRVAEDLWALSREEVDLSTVLDRHGWHGINNGQIHSTVWREDPDHVLMLVHRYRELPDGQRPSKRGARQQAERRAAEAALLAALPRHRAIRARLVLSLAQRFIAHREVGKAGYLVAVDGARAAARRLGQIWQASGAIEDPSDVFLLTLDEVAAGPRPGWPAKIAQRRSEQQRLIAQTIPEAWIGTPEPIDLDTGTQPGRASPEAIRGVGVNPGVVEGTARVVAHPDDDFEPGEILVCATTDPSWVAVFVAASAVVIDIGGHLSHGAIVARELGIPCIVNTRTGTRQLHSGDHLRIDGTTGEVAVLHHVTKERTA